MKAIRDMFGATARFDLLRALHFVERPVGLRELARLAEVHPHSAERMLGVLVEEGVVLREKRKERVAFRRNDRHEDWLTLHPLFEAIDQVARSAQREMLNQRGRKILPLIEQSLSMSRKGRASVRVP